MNPTLTRTPGIQVNHTERRHTQTEHEYAATDLETMQEARRYGDHLFNVFRDHIGKRVLEVGCGIGTMTERLLAMSDDVFAVEPNPYCAQRTRQIAALRSFRDVIVPGGKVLIFVPAIPAAYGPLDAERGHHRRYTKETLGRAFREAELPLVTTLHQSDRAARLDVQRPRDEVHRAQRDTSEDFRQSNRPVGAAARIADSAACRPLAHRRRGQDES